MLWKRGILFGDSCNLVVTWSNKALLQLYAAQCCCLSDINLTGKGLGIYFSRSHEVLGYTDLLLLGLVKCSLSSLYRPYVMSFMMIECFVGVLWHHCSVYERRPYLVLRSTSTWSDRYHMPLTMPWLGTAIRDPGLFQSRVCRALTPELKNSINVNNPRCTCPDRTTV